MIVVKFMGGLGNQMFQYAFGKALSNKYKEDLFYDFDFFSDVKSGKDKISTAREYELSIFNNISVKKADNATKQKIIGNKYLNFIRYKLGLPLNHFYQETKFSYNDEVDKLSFPVYLLGYWQSQKYFINISDSLRNDFQFNYENISIENSRVLEDIRNNHSSVSIHIRRGDYLKLPYLLSSLDYYRDSIDIINRKINNPYYYLFSDDPMWVKDNICPLVKNSTLIDWNSNEDSWIDMMLMSNCHHHIIANSSFSWWAAWLDSNSQKEVIAPKKWFGNEDIDTSDLFPDGWTTL